VYISIEWWLTAEWTVSSSVHVTGNSMFNWLLLQLYCQNPWHLQWKTSHVKFFRSTAYYVWSVNVSVFSKIITPFQRVSRSSVRYVAGQDWSLSPRHVTSALVTLSFWFTVHSLAFVTLLWQFMTVCVVLPLPFHTKQVTSVLPMSAYHWCSLVLGPPLSFVTSVVQYYSHWGIDY